MHGEHIVVQVGKAVESGTTPVYTGNTYRQQGARCLYIGPSPHTRRTLDAQCYASIRRWTIFAYTGNTELACFLVHLMQDHPRIHGEHLFWFFMIKTPLGPSPYTRGTQMVADVFAGTIRIIPVYTGNTFHRKVPPFLFQDYPRMHGEHISNHSTKCIGIRTIPVYTGNTATFQDCL